MRSETKEILDGICKMRRSQSPDSYTYLLDDKKVLHVFENTKTTQLSFLVNNAMNGDQYFLTDCEISDEKGILETVEYIVSRYIRPSNVTAVRVTVEKKASIAHTFYATPDQLQQIADGSNPFEHEMDQLFNDEVFYEYADSDYCIEDLDNGKILANWN